MISDDGEIQISRPRTQREQAHTSWLAKEQNYEVYTGIRLSSYEMVRFLAVLDTVAGPSLIREDPLPAETHMSVRKAKLLKIKDSNKRKVSLIGAVKLEIQLGSFTPLVEFTVGEKLAVPFILNGGFCDRLVEAIYRRCRCVMLYDGNTIPMMRSVRKDVIEMTSPEVHQIPNISKVFNGPS